MHRFLTNQEIDRINEILMTRKNLENAKEKYRLKSLECIEKELKKYC